MYTPPQPQGNVATSQSLRALSLPHDQDASVGASYPPGYGDPRGASVGARLPADLERGLAESQDEPSRVGTLWSQIKPFWKFLLEVAQLVSVFLDCYKVARPPPCAH